MGRPKGSPNRPGAKKPGKKPFTGRLPRLTYAEVTRVKKAVLALLDSGEFVNLAHTARTIGVSPARVYALCQNDEDMHTLVHFGNQIVADRLEIEILEQKTVPGVTARIFMLKGLRPEKFRDNWRSTTESPQFHRLMEDLRNLGKKAAQGVVEVTEIPEKEAPALLLSDGTLQPMPSMPLESHPRASEPISTENLDPSFLGKLGELYEETENG